MKRLAILLPLVLVGCGSPIPRTLVPTVVYGASDGIAIQGSAGGAIHFYPFNRSRAKGE